jgi:hypothetical protein
MLRVPRDVCAIASRIRATRFAIRDGSKITLVQVDENGPCLGEVSSIGALRRSHRRGAASQSSNLSTSSHRLSATPSSVGRDEKSRSQGSQSIVRGVN